MSPDEKKLTKLSSLAKNLNSESDNLNKSIESIEKRLSDMKLGVSVWLNFLLEETGPFIGLEEGDPSYVEGYQLGYSRIGDEWRISARKACEDAGGKYEVLRTQRAISLVSAPRIVRVEAAAFFDDLIDTLIENTEAYLKNIEKAQKIANN